MVTVISRFRVRNGLEEQVRKAFLERPRRVENEPGFCGLQVMTDASDPSVFVLLTRWTSELVFRAWHRSDSHHRSHEMIPQGLRLDASFTHVIIGEHVEGASSGVHLSDALEGQTVAITLWLAQSEAVFALLLGADGTVCFRNPAGTRLFPVDDNRRTIWDFCVDAEYLRQRLSGSSPGGDIFPLNLICGQDDAVSAEVAVIRCGSRSLLLGSIEQRKTLVVQDELLALTNRLSVMSREAVRRNKELEDANRTIERLARTDALSGLWNRRMFDEGLRREMERAGRQHHPLTMILADLDHFKSVNDTYGHVVGDLVIERTGEILRTEVRPYDLAARYGGEEFVVLLPGTTRDDGVVIAERLRKAIEAVQISDGPKQITISMGVAVWGNGELAENLIARADSALYRAKQAGRNRVEWD